MLCHCVTPANRAYYRAQLDEMFRQRHSVFVDGLGWSELRRADARDVDDYDHDDTVYLLVLGDAGEVLASARMNPTWGRCQMEDGGPLRERFVHLRPPLGPTVWEGSRLLGGLPELYGKDFARATLAILLTGLQEFCVRRQVTLGVSIFESRALGRLQALGWETEPLGLPVSYDTEKGQGEAIAARWKTGVRYMLLTRAQTGVVGPVLFEAGPPPGESTHDQLPFPLLETIATLRSIESRRELMRHALALIESEAKASADTGAPPPLRRLYN